jgi:Asp/Glu/hydantoin racemase
MEQAVRIAVSTGQIVYIVTLGPDADLISAERVSHFGLGQHYHAETAKELMEALQRIAEQSPTIIAQ